MKNKLVVTGFISLAIFANILSFSSLQAQGLVGDVLSNTNKFRKSRGLDALIINSDLNAIAQKHSENMARGRVGFGHGGFDKRFKEARKKMGAKAFAENVAYGARSGKEVVTDWKKSSGHRRNMLGKFKYIGIGAAKDRRGVIYYTQVFVN